MSGSSKYYKPSEEAAERYAARAKARRVEKKRRLLELRKHLKESERAAREMEK